ncbi:MAG: hypothetical protein WHX52_20170 [Anaerolineae bacterium]
MHKWRWRIGIALTLAALYGVTHVLAVWWHLPVLLSTPTAVCDMEPRSAISADGNWLASVWIQGRKINNGCVNRGAAILRWVTTDAAQNGWSSPVTLALPAAYATGCFVHTDVALDGSTAHVAATVWSPCDNTNADSAILHYTCDLASGACSPATVAMAQLGAEGLRLSDTRIVLDSQNRPHIVYGRGDHTLAQGKLFYTRNLGSGWSVTPVQLSPTSENAYRPSLAASNGRIHIAWQYHRDYIDTLGRLRQRGDVRYRYCEEEGVCNPVIGYPSPTTLVESTYPVPDIAARGDRVILTWNVCADVDNNPPCKSFYLVYVRSNTNGSAFPAQPLEVGTDTELRSITISTRYYAGSDDLNNPVGEYGMHLNPAIALDSAGLPYLAWQMQEGGGYVLTTTHAITVAEVGSGFVWAEGEMPQSGDGSDNRVYPSLMLTPVGDMQALHFIYMHTWKAEQWNRSQVHYDVAGPARPIVQLNYTERTSALPLERAQVITAQVTQQNGTPISNAPLLIKTTLGSFDPNGYGVSQLQTTTNAQGTATVTLYSNLVGTAQVSAWIDSVVNSSWDVEEPGAALTQTWVFTGTPTVSVPAELVEAGQWMTVNVRDHPYADLSDPYSTGEPVSYVMWWCLTAAPEYPPAQQLGGAFQVDINTWGRNMLVRAPMGMAGVYHIETHINTGGDTPCGNTDSLVAVSAIFTATAPSPALSVSPGPVIAGQLLTTTVLYHPYNNINGEPINYYLWWCPVNAPAVTQQIGEAFQVDRDTWSRANWTFRAPYGINGTYRLETHNANVNTPCSDPGSRVAVSPLISGTSSYPPGPLITLNNDRPYPDMMIIATLRQHTEGMYDVWWCTNYGRVVEQRVASAVTVNSDAVQTSVRVPNQVSGLYHLESHTSSPSAGCGNATTYIASSTLIWPYSRIYLPLVARSR